MRGILWTLLILGLAGSMLLNLVLLASLNLGADDSESRVQEKFYLKNNAGTQKVAVIGVDGAILESDGFIKHQIDRVLKDDGVKAVVLRIDSPGGTVTASDYLYHQLKRLREKRKIPIVVSMGGIAASGGYYLAMAVGDQPDAIYAEPSTFTGSIGVLIPHYDTSGLLEKLGVKDDTVASHRLKTMLSMTRPMTEEDRRIIQELVDESFAQFKEVVRAGRPQFQKDPAALDKLATGQIFTAQQAKRGGLVDRIGFVEDAVDRAIALASLDESQVKVVKYKREQGLASLLLGAQSHAASLDLAAILEMSTPRAYYLCTLLPAVVSSRR